MSPEKPSRPFWHRHTHSWTVIAESYNPPRLSKVNPGGYEGYDEAGYLRYVQSLIYGLTTVTQRCQGCGEQTAYTVVGKGSSEVGG